MKLTTTVLPRNYKEELIESLSHRAYPFFLESLPGQSGKQFGRYSFFGAEPFLVLKSKGRNITIETGNKVIRKQGDPFLELRRILRDYRVKTANYPVPFIGGGVGYLGYDLCHFVEKVPRTTKDDLNFPDMFFAFYDSVIAVDHIKNRTYRIEGNRLQGLKAQKLNDSNVQGVKSGRLQSNFTKSQYLNAVRRVKEYIAAGDIYQVNLSQRFSTDFAGSPLQLYRTLGEINPAPFSAFLQPNLHQYIISSSPERFLKLDTRQTAVGLEGRVETRPIKGTRPRGQNTKADNRLKRELYHSEKDNAELAMIVDLERNDLGRACKYGSVKVTQKKALETYPTVHHLVATVEGKLAPRYDCVDLIQATFPGGSITGAPKIRAMEIIDELEPTARGPYTGAIGWLGFDGSMDLSIAIRILLIVGKPNQTINRVYYQVGGGIVADSSPEAEYQETLDKGMALARAIEPRTYRQKSL